MGRPSSADAAADPDADADADPDPDPDPDADADPDSDPDPDADPDPDTPASGVPLAAPREHATGKHVNASTQRRRAMRRDSNRAFAPSSNCPRTQSIVASAWSELDRPPVAQVVHQLVDLLARAPTNLLRETVGHGGVRLGVPLGNDAADVRDVLVTVLDSPFA